MKLKEVAEALNLKLVTKDADGNQVVKDATELFNEENNNLFDYINTKINLRLGCSNKLP